MSSNFGSEQRHFATPLGLPIGSQTYPHRQRIIDGDVAGLCRDLAAIGIRDVELCDPGRPGYENLGDGKKVKNVLDDHGLTCSSGHFTMEVLRTRQQEMIAWAKEIGMTQMGTSTLNGEMQDDIATMDAVKRAADEYNKIAAAAARAGIQQFLHDERFEMSTIIGDGRRVYTVLLDLLDPDLVKMQFQMSAMPTVGDPIMYFKKYPGRFTSMHVQGVDLNDPNSAWKVAVGNDSVNWAETFKAAKAGGLKNYFVELNWDLTKMSVAYLKTLSV